MHVFISYNESDRKFISTLEISLKQKKIDYFLDEKSISYGDPISNSISGAFDNVTHLVVVISPGSKKSHWVSYEIGFALGRNIKVIPILTHPKLDLPPFISDLKYFKSLKEFDQHFHKISLNTLQIETSVDLMHGTDLGVEHPKLKGKIGLNKFKDEDEAKRHSEKMEPAFKIEIINRTGRVIEIKSPIIEFKKPQENIAADFSVDAVGFVDTGTNKEIVPGGRVDYLNFGKVCKGIILALRTDNIKGIVITSVDGFKYEIDPITLLEQKRYAEKFFNKI